MTTTIGLRELLTQLKDELTQETPDSPRLFFIEGAELELRVDVKREAKGGIKISILQFGGAEGQAGIAREQGHTITLKLRPLITYEEARQQLRKDESVSVETRTRALTKDPR